MGLFRRKLTNTAESILPPPPPATNQTIHNHGISWGVVILVGTIAGIVFIIFLWLFWVHLFAKMGSRQPEREAALWLILVPVVLVAGWLIKWVLLAILDSIFRYRLEIAKEVTERRRIELLALQSSVDPGRMTEADYQFAQVILAVMNETYAYTDKYKSAFKGRERPWSIDGVVRVAKGMNISITQTRAKDVKKWLVDNGVVIGELDGQVNVGEYPDLGKVRALIDRRFGKPITVNKYPPLRENYGYDHI